MNAVAPFNVQIETALTRLTGGLDTDTPSLSLQPGMVTNGVNYEVSQNGGYARIEGYEGYDGHTSPSSALFQLVQVDAFAYTPTAGEVIDQAVTGASATVIAVGSNYMIVTKVAGAFDYVSAISVGIDSLTITADNPITVTGTLIITASPIPVGTAVTPNTTLTAKQIAQYLALAADAYREDIEAVPGSGAVLGVVGATFLGVDCLFAFRANEAATEVGVWKASNVGWTQVPLFQQITFSTAGTAIPADGDTLTQGSVTATIKRVMAASGTFASTTAAGRLIITDIAGGSFSAGAATIGTTTLTLTSTASDITMVPGGKFEFITANFTGAAATKRIYGCDGTNKGFEFDGVTLAPITTGLTNDAPKHVRDMKNHLMWSYASSVIHSGPGVPYRYATTDGGGEFGLGDTVTNLLTMPGNQQVGAMAITTTGSTSILYGTSAEDFNLVPFNVSMGGIDYTAQNMADAYIFDMQGVIGLKATLNYGNFNPATLTKNMSKFIMAQRSKITDSCVSLDKSQYRVFFNDGYGLWLTVLNGKYLGGLPVLFPDVVFCSWNGNWSTGEVSFFGAEDGGYVYQLESGTSFDGEDIDAFVTFAWDAIRSPRILKRFRGESIEIQGDAYASVNFNYQLGYGTRLKAQPTPVSYASGFAAAPVWDSFTWDNFVWDGQTLIPTWAKVTGSAENIQITIASGTNYIAAYTVNSIIHQFNKRRLLRN